MKEVCLSTTIIFYDFKEKVTILIIILRLKLKKFNIYFMMLNFTYKINTKKNKRLILKPSMFNELTKSND